MNSGTQTSHGDAVSQALHDALVPISAQLLRCDDTSVELTRLAGGNSVITLLATDGGRPPADAVVLRVPPVAGRLPAAQDVLREFRALTALHPRGVPVPGPRAVIWEPTHRVPVLAEDYIPGAVLQVGSPELDEMDGTDRQTLADQALQALCAIHAAPIEETGLGSPSRASGYFHRQAVRWTQQLSTDLHPELQTWQKALQHACAWLQRADVGGVRAGVVHGDYDFHNLLFSRGSVEGAAMGLSAVLDWEMCTVGDTRTDLAWLLSRIDPTIPVTPLTPHPSVLTHLGFTRADVIRAYERAAGSEIEALEPFIVLARVKQVAIWVGHHGRARRGLRTDRRFDDFESYRDELLEAWLAPVLTAELPRPHLESR